MELNNQLAPRCNIQNVYMPVRSSQLSVSPFAFSRQTATGWLKFDGSINGDVIFHDRTVLVFFRTADVAIVFSPFSQYVVFIGDCLVPPASKIATAPPAEVFADNPLGKGHDKTNGKRYWPSRLVSSLCLLTSERTQ